MARKGCAGDKKNWGYRGRERILFEGGGCGGERARIIRFVLGLLWMNG